MKYFKLLFVIFCCLSPLLLLSQEYQKPTLQDVDKQVYSIERLKKLDQLYSQATAFCSGQGFHADMQAECIAQAKLKAKNEFSETLNILINKKIEDAQAKVIGDLDEQRCVSYYRQKLESLNIGYQVGDSCSELKALLPKI